MAFSEGSVEKQDIQDQQNELWPKKALRFFHSLLFAS
ncbi:hypothetical protein SAMN05216420_104174 [Nitrosospira sp. Nl5]|nr:hypothetical protein SAMN05216420_104174 [Nitrosospira sp. Nl5]